MKGYKSVHGHSQELVFRKFVDGDQTENAPVEISPAIDMLVQFVLGLPRTIDDDLICTVQALDDLFIIMIKNCTAMCLDPFLGLLATACMYVGFRENLFFA